MDDQITVYIKLYGVKTTYTLQDLVEAIKTNDTNKIEAILEEIPSFLKSIDEDNSSLLHWIASYEYEHDALENQFEMVDYLVNNREIYIDKKKLSRMPLH
ncbi:hypothetical protein TNCV_2907061 [Trichonephila clavipes]|nr:hypothetical protein TNCV_2907061 [Trichonephila clavipes]